MSVVKIVPMIFPIAERWSSHAGTMNFGLCLVRYLSNGGQWGGFEAPRQAWSTDNLGFGDEALCHCSRPFYRTITKRLQNDHKTICRWSQLGQFLSDFGQRWRVWSPLTCLIDWQSRFMIMGTFVMGRNHSVIVPLWGFHRSDVGKIGYWTVTPPSLVRSESRRARLNRLNEPDPLLLSVWNGEDLSQWLKSFCNRSAMGLSSFRYGGHGCLTTTWSIFVLFRWTMAQSKRFDEPDPMTIYLLLYGDPSHRTKSFCNRSDMGISSFRYGEKGLFDCSSTNFYPIRVNERSFGPSQRASSKGTLCFGRW